MPGAYAEIGRAIAAHLTAEKGQAGAMNIDGATAVIYAERAAAALARGFFRPVPLGRDPGHAWEQTFRAARNKGRPHPAYRWTHDGD